MESKNIRVAIYGLGGVGKELVRDLAHRQGIELVGAICRNPQQIGQDIGLLAGLDQPIGVQAFADQTKETDLYEAKPIDVLLHCAGANNARGTFAQVKSALEHGINVITANVGTTDLWHADPELAAEANAICLAHQASYFGIGSSQVLERAVIAMTEGSKHIESVSFTHYADVHAYSEQSNRNALGIGLHADEFERRRIEAQTNSAALNSNEESARFIGAYLGWEIDRVTTDMEPFLDAQQRVYGTQETIIGYERETERVRETWVFIMDEKQAYYDKIVLHGEPEVEAVMHYSPDRGLCTTYATLRNAIPVVLRAAPAYHNTLSLPACSWYGGDFRTKP